MRIVRKLKAILTCESNKVPSLREAGVGVRWYRGGYHVVHVPFIEKRAPRHRSRNALPRVMMKPKSMNCNVGDFHPAVTCLVFVGGGDDDSYFVVLGRIDKTYTPCVVAGSHVSKVD